MHRMIIALVCAATLAGCATTREAVPDPPAVARLRLSITKTRNAIRETREAIARSQGSPLLPELYVRLAELLGEEARYHNQVAYEREDRSSRLIHSPQVQLLKDQAIAVYRSILTRFPDTPLAPRIRFNIGHELRELGQFDAMVKVLDEVVALHPQSPLAGEALLVLGDYYFDKSQLTEAGKNYSAIATRPLSRVTSLGQYKLGWVFVNQGQCKEALASFEAALDASKAWAEGGDPKGDPRTPGASIEGEARDEGPATAQSIDVRREALVDLVYCYTQERDLDDVVAYLRARAANRATYVAALRRMADRLSLMNRPDAGLPVARELQRLAPADTDRIDDARVLYTFLRHELRPDAAASGGKAGAQARGDRFLFRAEDVRLLSESVLRWSQLPSVTDDLRTSTRDEFERYTRDLLTTAQERAQALQTGRDAALAEVADGYLVYLDAFPASPERLSMLENLVDVQSMAGRHLEAGMAALEAADLQTEPAKRQLSLLDGVSELQQALSDKGVRRPVARVVARAALRRAGVALLEGHAQGTTLPPERLRVVKFAIALSYFDEGRFREAIDRFTALAYEHPGSEEGSAALLLALEAYDAEGDYDGLINLGHRLTASDSPANAATLAKIGPAVARAEQQKLDELALAAAGTGGADLEELERYSARFAGTSLGERALVNAFVAARALGDNDAVQRLGQEIVAKYPASEQVTGIISTMARNALASLDYDRAVVAFEQAATAQNGEAVPLLLAAADIQASLGAIPQSEALLQKALAAAKTPATRAQIGAKLAESLEARGATAAETERLLAPLAADKDPRVMAALGLAQVAQNQGEAAEVTLQTVLGGQAEAAPDAKARAHLGSAEALAKLIAGFQADGSLDGLNELTALVDLVEEAYLTAARQNDPYVTPMALGRMAATARMAATKLRGVALPNELDANDRAAVKQGLEARSKQLDALAAGALQTCASQAWSSKVFNPAARRCLVGEAIDDPRILHDVPRARQRTGAASVSEALRQKLADNPEDQAALLAVGAALLDAGDAHTARLVLSRGGGSAGPEAQNLLGVACYQIGDYTMALESFARAADAGLEAGRENLKTALGQAGASAAVPEVDKRWPEAKTGGGRLIGGR